MVEGAALTCEVLLLLLLLLLLAAAVYGRLRALVAAAAAGRVACGPECTGTAGPASLSSRGSLSLHMSVGSSRCGVLGGGASHTIRARTTTDPFGGADAAPFAAPGLLCPAAVVPLPAAPVEGLEVPLLLL